MELFSLIVSLVAELAKLARFALSNFPYRRISEAIYISVAEPLVKPVEGLSMSVVCLDVETMLKLNAEQLESDCIWPHPWEHYPFVVDGVRQWVRYQNLQVEQKQVICNALNKYD